MMGDKLHMVFECAILQPLRLQYPILRRHFFSQADFGVILGLVLSCLECSANLLRLRTGDHA